MRPARPVRVAAVRAALIVAANARGKSIVDFTQRWVRASGRASERARNVRVDPGRHGRIHGGAPRASCGAETEAVGRLLARVVGKGARPFVKAIVRDEPRLRA